jgi:hypothetical protein
MKRSAEEAGRDPDSIEITALGSTKPERVAQLARLGVSRILFFADDISALPALAEKAFAAASAAG